MSADEREAMAARMGTVATVEGRALSLHNALLVYMQRPDATIVGGFRQWLAAGRSVRKGEHGVMIWAPGGERAAHEDADDVIDEATSGPRFVMITVFDVAQTEEAQR